MESIALVLKKELAEWWHGQRPRAAVLQLAFLVLVFGVLLPARSTEGTSQLLPYMVALAPVFLVSNLMADSFAGERERGTLETLLATPLPDYAILAGKVLAGVVYTWCHTLVVLLVTLVTLTLGRGIDLPPLTILAASSGALLIATLLASIGAWVSMHARTARSAQQALGLPLMGLYLVIGFGVLALLDILPVGWGARLAPLLSQAQGAPALAVTLGVLILLDSVCLAIALRAFHRPRLLHPD